MLNPAGFGVSPQQMAAARELGNFMAAKFVKERSRHRFSVEFVPKVSQAELARLNIDLGQAVDKWVEVMAGLLYTYMGVGGEIEDGE